jgi:hypothetical protein
VSSVSHHQGARIGNLTECIVSFCVPSVSSSTETVLSVQRLLDALPSANKVFVALQYL